MPECRFCGTIVEDQCPCGPARQDPDIFGLVSLKPYAMALMIREVCARNNINTQMLSAITGRSATWIYIRSRLVDLEPSIGLEFDSRVTDSELLAKVSHLTHLPHQKQRGVWEQCDRLSVAEVFEAVRKEMQ